MSLLLGGREASEGHKLLPWGAACGKLDVDSLDDWFRLVLSSTGCKLKAGAAVSCNLVSLMGQLFEASFGFPVLITLFKLYSA